MRARKFLNERRSILVLVDQPARARCVHVKINACVCVCVMCKAWERATLGPPFKIERKSHVLVLSTQIIARRRVAWNFGLNQFFERSDRAEKVEMVYRYSRFERNAWKMLNYPKKVDEA